MALLVSWGWWSGHACREACPESAGPRFCSDGLRVSPNPAPTLAAAALRPQGPGEGFLGKEGACQSHREEGGRHGVTRKTEKDTATRAWGTLVGPKSEARHGAQARPRRGDQRARAGKHNTQGAPETRTETDTHRDGETETRRETRAGTDRETHVETRRHPEVRTSRRRSSPAARPRSPRVPLTEAADLAAQAEAAALFGYGAQHVLQRALFVLGAARRLGGGGGGCGEGGRPGPEPRGRGRRGAGPARRPRGGHAGPRLIARAAPAGGPGAPRRPRPGAARC